jgi:superfamily II DNA/RNA helicase
VHRIGRTGRAGASGDALSIYSDKDERLLADIEKLIKQTIKRGDLDGFNPAPTYADERGERRPRRSEDAGRPAPPARSGERGERPPRAAGAPSYGAGRREKVDPWFLKPYEPAKAAVPAPSAALGSAAAKPKQKVAFLLGGAPKQPAQ